MAAVLILISADRETNKIYFITIEIIYFLSVRYVDFVNITRKTFTFLHDQSFSENYIVTLFILNTFKYETKVDFILFHLFVLVLAL